MPCHGYAAYCQCQKLTFRDWAERQSTSVAERMERLQEQTRCGYPSARTTSGLVAYLDGEPVGWCAVEPHGDPSGRPLVQSVAQWADVP
jgi:hypothetical protein